MSLGCAVNFKHFNNYSENNLMHQKSKTKRELDNFKKCIILYAKIIILRLASNLII